MRLRNLALIIALLSGVAFGQGGHVDLPAIFSQSSSPMQIPGLAVTVCLSTATVTAGQCSPTVSTFSDQALTQPIANLQTNGDGLFPFWISPGTYQYCLSGSPIVSFCNPFTVGVAPGSAPSFSSLTLPEGTAPSGVVGSDILYADSSLHRPRFINNGGAAASVALLTDNLGSFGTTTSAQLASAISDESGTGPLIFANGSTFASKSENDLEVVHVEQYASWALAHADCISIGGCVLDGSSFLAPSAIGTIDPGSAVEHVKTGPWNYTLDHFVMRSGLEVAGAGVENIQGTKIQAVGTGAPFIMPTSGTLQSVQGVKLHDFQLQATSGNSAQDAIFADVSVGNLPAGSNFEAFELKYLTLSGFKGSTVHFKGPVAAVTSVDQFGKIAFVTADVPASNTTVGSCLRLEGAVGQINYENFSCSQQGGSPTETGIFIGATSGTDAVGPYSQWFEGTTIQNMNIGANISGCSGCSFHNTHLEIDNIPWQTNVISTSVPNQNLVLDGGTANSNVASNSGNGVFLDMSSANNNLGTGTAVKGWTFSGNPDKLCKGVNGVNVTFTDNRFQQPTPAMVTTTCAPFGTSTSTTTLNTLSFHYAYVNGASGGAISTLTSGLAVGEVLTLYANVTFSLTTGGNINLGGNAAPIVVPAGQTIQLINGDVSGSNLWYVIGLQNQMKSQRFTGLTATGTTQGSSATTAVTWATAFADANYTVSCTGRTPTNTPGGLDVESVGASGFTIRIFNLGSGAAANYADADCIARHD